MLVEVHARKDVFVYNQVGTIIELYKPTKFLHLITVVQCKEFINLLGYKNIFLQVLRHHAFGDC